MLENREVQLADHSYDSLKSSVEVIIKQFDTDIWDIRQAPKVSHHEN